MNRWPAIAALALSGCGNHDPGSTSAEPRAATEEPLRSAPAREDDGSPRSERSAAAAAAQTFPLKDWMTANLNRPLRTDDFDALARSLTTAAGYAPRQFTDWSRIARQGAEAAAAHDMSGVRTSCTECHNKYRAEYKSTMRTQALVVAEPRSR
jgi:hypothetical protein